jgi:hypothetical protein
MLIPSGERAARNVRRRWEKGDPRKRFDLSGLLRPPFRLLSRGLLTFTWNG